MNLLLIDHEDSFTYNLAHLLSGFGNLEVKNFYDIKEKSIKIRKIWKIPFCGAKVCKMVQGCFLGNLFWPPIWEPKSMKIRKNASQKPSQFAAVFERAPGGAF